MSVELESKKKLISLPKKEKEVTCNFLI